MVCSCHVMSCVMSCTEEEGDLAIEGDVRLRLRLRGSGLG